MDDDGMKPEEFRQSNVKLVSIATVLLTLGLLHIDVTSNQGTKLQARVMAKSESTQAPTGSARQAQVQVQMMDWAARAKLLASMCFLAQLRAEQTPVDLVSACPSLSR